MSESDIRKYIEAKALMSTLEEKVERYRRRILDQMQRDGIDELSGSDYKAKIRTMRMEHVYKKDVPSDIWNRYKKETQSTQLVITQKKKTTSKSP
jgi:hypothetical protein